MVDRLQVLPYVVARTLLKWKLSESDQEESFTILLDVRYLKCRRNADVKYCHGIKIVTFMVMLIVSE